MHHTKDKGDLATAEVIAYLARKQVTVCIPLSEHLPFDLVAVSPDMTLSRLQCKYCTVRKDGTVKANLRSCYSTSKGVKIRYANFANVDAYTIFCPDTNFVYFVPASRLKEKRTEFSMRVVPTRRKLKNVIDANDFMDYTVIWP